MLRKPYLSDIYMNLRCLSSNKRIRLVNYISCEKRYLN